MAEKNFQSEVSRITCDVLKKMGVDPISVEVRSGKAGLKESFICSVSVSRDDSRILIGQHGVTLSALQHLVQTLAKQELPSYEGFSIDVNNYWKEKQFLLERDAEEAAREAVATGRPVHLRPMLSYERKIVHAALSGNDRVETESSGHGENRRITVKPASIL